MVVLAEQLATNRQLTETLQIQAKDLKVCIRFCSNRKESIICSFGEWDSQGQAVHSGTGFPLRRFNIDISDGEEELFQWEI